jgi:hypothetical protein
MLCGSCASLVVKNSWISERKVGHSPGSFPGSGTIFHLWLSAMRTAGNLAIFISLPMKHQVMPYTPLWSVRVFLCMLCTMLFVVGLWKSLSMFFYWIN